MTPDQLKYKQIDTPIMNKWNELKTRNQTTRPQIGNGLYADVYEPENDPGSVDKVAKPGGIQSLSKDGYYQYLETISKNSRMQNNPFFPKVYKLETFKDKNATYPYNEYTYEVNLEKLHPLKSLSAEEAIRLGRNLFTDFDVKLKERKKEYGVYKHKPSPTDPDREERREQTVHAMAIPTLADCFDHALAAHTPVTTIKNSHLKQAILLIRNVIKRAGGSPDLHSGNLMVRRGPFEPQIVITDPVS
jgi:hypothetical protein